MSEEIPWHQRIDFLRGDLTMVAMLSIEMQEHLEDSDDEYVTKWGYGQVDIFAAIYPAAKALIDAVDKRIDDLPGVPFYELPYYLPPIPEEDPMMWWDMLVEKADECVDTWITEIEKRMKEHGEL